MSRTVWGGFTIQWYLNLPSNDTIMDALFTTLRITLSSSILATVLGTSAAIGINRMKKRHAAIMLGATEALKPSLMLYIKGYAIGIIPQLLAQQIASFLQLERQNKRSYIGIGAMIIANIATDIIFVSVMSFICPLLMYT